MTDDRLKVMTSVIDAFETRIAKHQAAIDKLTIAREQVKSLVDAEFGDASMAHGDATVNPGIEIGASEDYGIARQWRSPTAIWTRHANPTTRKADMIGYVLVAQPIDTQMPQVLFHKGSRPDRKKCQRGQPVLFLDWVWEPTTYLTMAEARDKLRSRFAAGKL